jgi:hypothetical protein
MRTCTVPAASTSRSGLPTAIRQVQADTDVRCFVLFPSEFLWLLTSGMLFRWNLLSWETLVLGASLYIISPCLIYRLTERNVDCSSRHTFSTKLPLIRLITDFPHAQPRTGTDIVTTVYTVRLLAFFPHFGKIKGGLWDQFAVCVSVSPQKLICNVSVNTFQRQRIHTQQ